MVLSMRRSTAELRRRRRRLEGEKGGGGNGDVGELGHGPRLRRTGRKEGRKTGTSGDG